MSFRDDYSEAALEALASVLGVALEAQPTI